ncbi:MAG: hypothetical protein ACRDG7_08800, partial [Candidatus Limnocylindria bacterium]
PAPRATGQPPAPVEVAPAVMTGIERAIIERRRADEREAVAVPTALDSQAVETAATAAPAPVAEPQIERAPRRLPRPSWAPRPGPSLVLLILPLVGAGVAWGAAVVLDRMPEPGTDLGRLTTLALVLAGPATTVGAIMARFYWPRIVGVVVAGGLATTVFVGRALLG